MNIEDFNRRWLKAWTDKDVQGVLSFYAADTVYRDPQTVAGLKGHEALGAYLESLFGGTPPMRYEPDEVWTTPNGFCGRWYCTITPSDGPARYLRGFDLVVLRGDRITLNEVYVHHLDALPEGVTASS